MQVKYNCWEKHPVSIKFSEFSKKVPHVYTWKSDITKYLPSMNVSMKKLYEEFLKDPLIEAYKGDYLRPDFRANLHDMKGRPMKLGSLFIQNHARKLSVYVVSSVGKTGGARVNKLDKHAWSGYLYGALLTKPKPEYYLIVEPSFLSDEQKECLEKVFEQYPICKEGFEEQYGRNR